MFTWIFHILIFATGSDKYQNKEKPLKHQRKLGLTTDVCLTADPGVASLIAARSHTFMEIDHDIISTVRLILQHSADPFKKGCQLQARV